MLAKLSSIDWTAIAQAHGPAKDVPLFLRTLTSADRAARDDAFERLVDQINHQGGARPAALAAIPFLVELATEPSVPERGRLLRLLADLAVARRWSGSRSATSSTSRSSRASR